jgi:hypothetical protein
MANSIFLGISVLATFEKAQTLEELKKGFKVMFRLIGKPFALAI